MDDNTSLKAFDNDFKFLSELKLFWLNYLRRYSAGEIQLTEKELHAGVYSKLSEDRDVRIVLPRSTAETITFCKTVCEQSQENSQTESTPDIEKNDQLYFVGFIGYSRPKTMMTDEFVTKLWDFDGELIGELPRQKHIVAYVTAERERGGNWGNMVVFNSQDAIAHWREFQYHFRAVGEISPKAYTHIRIHRGKLQEDLENGKFCVTQTIFLDYGPECTGQYVTRKVEVWSTQEQESSTYFETDR